MIGMEFASKHSDRRRGYVMPSKISEVRTVYLPSRRREVRCRLWYEVSLMREGLYKYFLLGIEELE
jgi:hypothetical protein